MSMRGEIISKEYQDMVWAKDENGKEFVCYTKDVKDKNHLRESEKSRCLDTSQTLGESW